MKFTIRIFGCQMNYADASRIRAMLESMERVHVDSINEANVIILVTCSVRAKAEDKVTGFMKKVNPHQDIWITGCMAQRLLKNGKIQEILFPEKKIPSLFEVGNFLPTQGGNATVVGKENNDRKQKVNHENAKAIPINHAFNPLFHRLSRTYQNLKLVFRIDDTGYLPLILQEIGYSIQQKHLQECIDEYSHIIPKPLTIPYTQEGIMHEEEKAKNASDQEEKRITPVSAYLPISTGCSQFCSYCIVPYARGLERYYPVEQIIHEAKTYIQQGVQEITLLGQIVNKHPHFVEILKQILALPGNLKWLRYTSPYPTFFSNELLELHANEPKLCPHIHIPVQSGSNKILKLMKRGYTVEQFKEVIDRIRKLPRHINLTTDIIVGFSNETEEDFEATLDLVRYCQFTMIFIGKYSVRPGTRAAKNLPDNIPVSVKNQRWHKVNELFMEIAKEQHQKDIGSTKEVLVTTVSEKEIRGYTACMKHVTIKGWKNEKGKSYDEKQIIKGKFITSRIVDADALTLYGEIV